jgi:prepilin-type N-terminal cleavage/methylation domain-containing protein
MGAGVGYATIISIMNKSRGFTIVELLIVIVVIAILAAITIVAFNGIQERSQVARAQSDMSNMQKLVELYRGDNSTYPLASSWVFQATSNRNTFIPGLVPEYASALPLAGPNAQYIYRTNSTGTEFKIMRYRAAVNGGIPSGEWNNVPASMKDGNASNQDRYGVWSSGGLSL